MCKLGVKDLLVEVRLMAVLQFLITCWLSERMRSESGGFVVKCLRQLIRA